MDTINRCTAAMFDLDGVLIDSESQYSDFWRNIGKEYFPGDNVFVMDIKGMTLTKILAKYFSDKAGLAEEITRRLDDFEAHMDFRYVPGAMAFVSSLREAGIKVAVVTSSDKAKMSKLYAAHPGFADNFDLICTAEGVKRSKPAPDCYLACAERLGCETSRSVIFEDSFNGLEAVQNSGAKVVGLSTSNPESAISKYCDCVISDFTAFSLKNLETLFEK